MGPKSRKQYPNCSKTVHDTEYWTNLRTTSLEIKCCGHSLAKYLVKSVEGIPFPLNLLAYSKIIGCEKIKEYKFFNEKQKNFLDLDVSVQQVEVKKVKTVEVEKYAVIKQKLYLLLLRQFINNRKNTPKNSICKLIFWEKIVFAHKV